jgi:uncharacterized protein
MTNKSHEQEFPRGILRPELFIGLLSAVSASSVHFTLKNAGLPSGAHFLGGRYGKGEVGEFVLIEGQTNLLLGRIVETHLPEGERKSVDTSRTRNEGLDAIGTIQLLGSVAMDSLSVKAGVDAYPRLGDRIYAAPHDFVASLPKRVEPKGSAPSLVLLELGTIGTSTESTVAIRPEKLFGRHCAILGATGGGKSWTTARIIEECLKHKTKIILLDATGEYRDFSSEFVSNFHLGSPVYLDDKSQSEPASLPPTCFVESDFIALFDPAGKVQGPKLRAAIKSLRLAQLAPEIAENGIIEKINSPRTRFDEALRRPGMLAAIENPEQAFDVKKLSRQIEQECAYPEAARWGNVGSDFAYCLSLLSRIGGVLSSSSFGCVFRSTEPALTTSINSFITNDKRLLRVCLSGVAYEFKAREIVANVIGRYLLNLARKGEFKNAPMVVIVDEAHNFLGRQIGEEDCVAKLDAFELIAKEGRKYGLNICLTTQRPRDITEGVLSQMGTLIVHRLTNDRDREVVERACGEIDRAASAFLPNLKPGEAAIIGADFPIPLTIQISPPETRPRSDGPDFQSHWAIDVASTKHG